MANGQWPDLTIILVVRLRADVPTVRLQSSSRYEPLESFYLNAGSSDTPTSSITTENTSNVPVHQWGSTIINEHHGQMAIFDATGKMIARTRNDYNMQSLPDGVYFVRIAGINDACRVIKK